MSKTPRKSNARPRGPRAASSTDAEAPEVEGDDIGAAELTRRVADNLRVLRKQRDLSLDELAARSGVSRATLSQVETCKTNPTIAILWKIAAGLGVPFASLLGEERVERVRVLRRGDAQV
ncbi:MAG: helix-turn-helix transcriptional regulator, partial [Deltaproteobacteria bacterium]|nr:helix-turn-helix transcriptional regulator [Deltaproteobacteria bacterium]